MKTKNTYIWYYKNTIGNFSCDEGICFQHSEHLTRKWGFIIYNEKKQKQILDFPWVRGSSNGEFSRRRPCLYSPIWCVLNTLYEYLWIANECNWSHDSWRDFEIVTLWLTKNVYANILIKIHRKMYKSVHIIFRSATKTLQIDRKRLWLMSRVQTIVFIILCSIKFHNNI